MSKLENNIMKSKSDYCYATLILGLSSLFLYIFLPAILGIVYFIYSRKEAGIKLLNNREIIISRIGLLLCVLSIIINIMLVIIFIYFVLGMVMMTHVWIG